MTTARAYSTGDRIEIRITAQTFLDASGIETDEIVAAMISAGAVTEAKIGTGAVTEAKIGTGAVTEGKIASNAVIAAKIANNAVTTDKLNSEAVTLAKLNSSGLFMTQFAERSAQQSLVGDSGWQDHLSMTFTVGKTCNVLFLYSSSSSFESGPVQGFARLVLDGTMIGRNSCVAKQSTANAAGSGTVMWDKQGVAAGTHTIKIQVRNTQGGSTWITPYYDADSQTSNMLGAIFYA